MNNSNLYIKAVNLANEIGAKKPLKTNDDFLKLEIKSYEKNIKNRAKNYNRAIELSKLLQEPLQRDTNPYGSSNEDWIKEVRRLRMRNRRSNSKIDKLLDEKKFQEIINIPLKDRKSLTEEQANKFFNKVSKDGVYLMKTVYEKIEKDKDKDKIIKEERTVTVNKLSRKGIIRLLTGIIVNGNIYNTMEGGLKFSDYSNYVFIEKVLDCEISGIKKPTKSLQKSGLFFPYINTSNLNLSRYQIFNKTDIENKNINKEHCLFKSLELNNIKLADLNRIKLAFVNGYHIRKAEIRKIAVLLEKNIVICTIKNNYSKDNELIEINKYKFKCDKKDAENIEIALYEGHYFIYEETKYSRCFINNYEKLKDVENAYNITRIKTKNNKDYYTRSEDVKINSLLLVHKLFNQNYFVKSDLSIFEETSSHEKLKNFIYLDNIENEQKLYEIKFDQNIKKNRERIFYADCESFVNKKEHEIQLIGVVEKDNKNDDVKIFDIGENDFDTQTLVNKFLNFMTDCGNSKDTIKCYFHNLKYDYHLFEKYVSITDKCQKDGMVYSIKIKHNKSVIEFRDSFKLLSFKLADFNKELKLPTKYYKKEAIAYKYYTKENHNKRININDYLSLLSVKERITFNEQINTEPSFDKKTNTFNPLSYYKDYLKLDCLVLKYGLEKFNELIREVTFNEETQQALSIYDYLTISSLTDRFMGVNGAYDDIYTVTGNLREYISKAVYGGRVNVNEKYIKKEIEEKISDYDGVSLYPSSINRTCREFGLPKGQAKRLIDLNSWKDKDYSILTVKITKVNKYQQMPFIAVKIDGESINYSNNVPDEELIIDSITLEDYINFHQIEYIIKDGVYWDEGFNKAMGSVVQKLFNKRLQIKKANPALGNVIKLMLNSAYGKTIMKKTHDEVKIVATKKWKKDNEGNWTENKYNFETYIYNNFQTIKDCRKINDSAYEVNRICADMSYNRGHIGCLILSMSKRIMNEVFDIANDNNCVIYYTDTDSIHCKYNDVKIIEDAYYKKYNKVLNGVNLEQFHTDFDIHGIEEGETADIYAIKSIFLGKKSYIDVLEAVVEKDGVYNRTIHGTHHRLKGITKEGINHTAKKYKDSYYGLYSDLAKGNELKIVLNPFDTDENKEKVLFEFKKGLVSTKDEFVRSVKF